MKRGIDSLGSIQGKRALVRVDFNVPTEKGAVKDDFRLRAALPTLRRLAEKGARSVLVSHLGRPDGKPDPDASLAPVAKALSGLLGRAVAFCAKTTGPEAQAAAEKLKPGELLVLENVRFDPGEKKNDPAFAKALAGLADVYVNDAFGTCHRKDASVVGVPKLLPSAAGDLVAAEVKNLEPLRNGTAARPFVVILGGAKLADKIPVLEGMVDRVDAFLIGGGMSYTLLKAQGRSVGKSKLDDSLADTSRRILELAREKARSKGLRFVLPVDHQVARGLDDPSGYSVVEGDVPDGLMGLDVGPATIASFLRELKGAKTVFWNGPLGVFEKPPFDLGTRYLASYLACRASDTKTVVGGGDSAAAARELGLADRMAFVSTGGGASLEYVQGAELPGIAALPEA